MYSEALLMGRMLSCSNWAGFPRACTFFFYQEEGVRRHPYSLDQVAADWGPALSTVSLCRL